MQIERPTATLSEPYWWTYWRDPAFDQRAEGFSAEALNEALEGGHWDRINAWLKPGKKGPARFKLRHLLSPTVRHLQGLMAQRGALLICQRSCAMALMEIENPDGKPFPVRQSARDAEFGETCLTDDLMEVLEYAGCSDGGLEKGEVVTAIGARALRSATPSGN